MIEGTNDFLFLQKEKRKKRISIIPRHNLCASCERFYRNGNLIFSVGDLPAAGNRSYHRKDCKNLDESDI
jgi:hypothetical protein